MAPASHDHPDSPLGTLECLTSALVGGPEAPPLPIALSEEQWLLPWGEPNGAVTHPPCHCSSHLPAQGLGVALKTPLRVGLSLGLELEKGPSPEPLPVPVLSRPQVPLGDPAQGSWSPSPRSPVRSFYWCIFFTGNEPFRNECRLVCIKTCKLLKKNLRLVPEAATEGSAPSSGCGG